MEASKKSGKLVFAFFTGSDWCGPCKEFTRTILSTSTFRNWARTNVHLLEVDFPERKAQSDMIKRQNEALANTYRVTGFPTVLLITPDRKTYARLSISSRTTPQTFVDNLNQLVKRYNQDRRIRR
jgi:protein disulfide-isomerase